MTVLAKGCRKIFLCSGKLHFFAHLLHLCGTGGKDFWRVLRSMRKGGMRGLEVSGAAAWDRTLTGLLEDLPEMRRKLRGELMELAGKEMENKGTNLRSSFEAEAVWLAEQFVEKFAKKLEGEE